VRRALLTTVLAVSVAGCGSDAAQDPSGPPAPSSQGPAGGGTSQADDDLQIEIDLGDGGAPQTWTLTCVGVVEGTHPAAQAACDHLAGLESPFAPLPDDVVCSQQYGGPQTARVLGRWNAEPVDLELSRVDGCRIAQWDALVPVVPAPLS
jgi:hypothetical protein